MGDKKELKTPPARLEYAKAWLRKKYAEDPEYKAKHKADVQAWREKNREKKRAADKARRAKDPTNSRAGWHRYKAKHPERAKALNKASYEKNKEKVQKGIVARLRLLQTVVYEWYGDKCACCGVKDRAFFNIDHVNNDGKSERSQGIVGYKLYKTIIDNDFPESYQILCYNCNMAKAKLGMCPHERDRLSGARI